MAHLYDQLLNLSGRVRQLESKRQKMNFLNLNLDSSLGIKNYLLNS